MSLKSDIENALSKYLAESREGLIAEQPSRLNRGEGTQAPYFMLKIDLANSTRQLQMRSPAIYLKLSHAYLSTLDEITHRFGADSDQTEYAGDSVLAYFPRTIDIEQSVIACAGACRFAVDQIRKMDVSLRQIELRTRIVCHYGMLIVANIGPWGARQRKVMGLPLHSVARAEESITAGSGLVTLEAAAQITPKYVSKYLYANYRSDPASTALNQLTGGFGLGGFGLNPGGTKTIEYYLMRWGVIYRDLDLQ